MTRCEKEKMASLQIGDKCTEMIFLFTQEGKIKFMQLRMKCMRRFIYFFYFSTSAKSRIYKL